jgi:hypothetical protein
VGLVLVLVLVLAQLLMTLRLAPMFTMSFTSTPALVMQQRVLRLVYQ